jgi:hypothetical protein
MLVKSSSTRAFDSKIGVVWALSWAARLSIRTEQA